MDHVAALLPDGKVLIAGGVDGIIGSSAQTNVYDSAELFDPTTEKFTVSSMRMSVPRALFTATSLNTGKVLIAGGVSSAVFLATAELFDPANGSFTATGSLSEVRFLQDATLLNDGTVLLSGGRGAAPVLASVELYDPTTGMFSLTGGLITPRAWHTSTLLDDGRVLVTGGGVYPVASAELYQ
jgi:hypothetical protein